jgi:hypothetical protein
MSSKPKNVHGDHEYLRSLNIERGICEDEYDVVVTTTISLRDSPYRLRVRIEAWDWSTEEEPQAPLCSYEADWPNAQAISWCAFLFNSMVKLARLVEDSKRYQWYDSLRAQQASPRQ